MNENRVLMEALEKIVEETCICLESDRASVFIYDGETEQLWTKVAKGSSKTIKVKKKKSPLKKINKKVPYNKGIVGHVFTKGESLNVLNAYNDERFNKEIDKYTNYKTNTILAYPLFDDEGSNVIGVI